MNLITENQISLSPLDNARVAILGYGSQGRAHALNLKDSGINVTVGARTGGESHRQAEADGCAVATITEAAAAADIVMVLLPDTAQPEVYRAEIAPNLRAGALLLFAHGFNIQYKAIEPAADIDVGMVAPKSPGALVRRQFELGRGVPCLFAIHQNPSGTARDRTLAYSHALGGTRAGVLETTFAEETETDLFGEQAVLCGGVTELILAGFETLTAAGYQPEVAYFECLHELKLIVDLLYEGGLARLHRYVSDTAKYGDLSRGPRVIDDRVRQKMAEILEEIRNGTFAREWMSEHENGRPRYREMLETDLEHPIERIGRELRQRMDWLPNDAKFASARATR